jgi:hypothetical protein
MKENDSPSASSVSLSQSKPRQALFVAAILMMMLGFLRMVEGLVMFLAETIIDTHASPVTIKAVGATQTVVGLTVMICAYSVLNLSQPVWRLSFFAVPILVVWCFFSEFIIFESLFGFGTVINLVLATVIILMLNKGRDGFQSTALPEKIGMN